ncbi:MAG: ATP-binding protein [Bacteroidota bacterium]
MFKRPHYQLFITRLQEPRKFIQVIIGPRQVGKTTLISQVLKDLSIPSLYTTADAVSASSGSWIEHQWDVARAMIKHKRFKEYILVIDEIQKINNWSEYVKAQWDKDSREGHNIKLVLLGSASLLIQKGLNESLMGRYETTLMLHWSYPEMKAAFGFSPEQYVWFGGYPGAAALIDDETRWKQYVEDSLVAPTIMKDILMISRIDKPALFKRLFELASAYSGQILAFNKMLGQLQDAGNTTTLSHYLNLLDNAAMVKGISKIYKEQVRQKTSIPKLQVYNSSLFTVQIAETFEQIQLLPDKWGRHVESAIGAHLINYARSESFNVYYWRHRHDEVDFIIEKKGVLIALEVISGTKQKAKGMDAFKNAFAPQKVLLIGNTGIPWQEFLGINPADLF